MTTLEEVVRASQALRDARISAERAARVTTLEEVVKAAQAIRAARASAERAARAFARLAWALTPEPERAGLEARYYVRGGMDPAYGSEAARDAELRRLLALGYPTLAASFARGWAEHHDAPAPLGWHGTWMGQSRSFVTPTSGESA